MFHFASPSSHSSKLQAIKYINERYPRFHESQDQLQNAIDTINRVWPGYRPPNEEEEMRLAAPPTIQTEAMETIRQQLEAVLPVTGEEAFLGRMLALAKYGSEEFI